MTSRSIRARLIRPLGAVAMLGAILGGCAMYDGDVSSYGRYNGSIGVGVGAGYADGFGYGPGWYDGFYYPGSGLWVYDRGGRRHRWRQGEHRRDARPGWTGGSPPTAGVPGHPPGGGVEGGPRRVDGRDGGRAREGVGARPLRRAPDAAARPPRPAPVARAPARPTREGRNQHERPD